MRHYVDLINHATRTFDTAPMRSASATRCTQCKAIAALYEGIRRDGGEVSGGQWTIERIETRGVLFDRQRANVLVSYPRQVVRYKANKEPRTFDPGEALFLFEYQRRGSGFVIIDIIGPVQ